MSRKVLHAIRSLKPEAGSIAIGLRGQFAVMRDRFACKPMVVAETDAYVACGSEFRALAHLPGVNEANIFEPEPEGIFVWSQ